jgi:hypothetical protein
MRSLISVIHLLGSVLALFPVLFLLPIATALYYHEPRSAPSSPVSCAAWSWAWQYAPPSSASAPSSSRAMATCSSR